MFLEAFVMSTTTTTHLATLLNYLISTYFIRVNTVLIVHNSTHQSELKQQYLNDVQLALSNQSAKSDYLTSLLWLDVAGMHQNDFERAMLRAVGTVIEGFITILPETLPFLHARYYATRIAKLRLKDKFHLFLCEEHENPKDLLAAEILQFYPHHLMVRPKSTKQTIVDKKIVALNKLGVKQNNMKKSASGAQATRVLERKASTKAMPFAQLRDINFELWTQKFVGSVGNLDAVLLDAFLPNKTFVHNAELYPNKLLDLKGRTLKVGSITYVPYVATNYVAAGTGDVDPINPNHGKFSVRYIGSEAALMKTFCQIRNCHLLVRPFGADNWGAIYDNQSSNGMLGDLYNQRIELAIGCIYNWYDEITETSRAISRSSVTLLGPAPALTPPWYTNIAPFSTPLWIFICITMIICSIMFYIIGIFPLLIKKRQIRHINYLEESCLNIFAVFLQQPSAPIGIKRIAGRILLTTLLAATITLENTYSGQLKSMLTIPIYTEPVDTIEKWSKTGWEWAAPSDIWVETVAMSTLQKERILTQSFRVLDYKELYNRSFRNDYGLGIERLYSGTFTFGRYITAPIMKDKIILKDDLYFDFTLAVAIRGWPLMPLLNEHIARFTESGLYEYFERTNGVELLDPQIQSLLMTAAYGHKNKEPVKKLSVENIAGALFLITIGHTLAIFVFVIEIFRSAFKQKITFLQTLLENRRVH